MSTGTEMAEGDAAAATAAPGARFTSLFISAPDGLKLHVRSYGPRLAPTLPVVCLPGLARTAADFDTIGVALANDVADPRRVIAVDYRGRGRSEYDRNPSNYALPVELGDLSAVLTALDIRAARCLSAPRAAVSSPCCWRRHGRR